MTQSKQGSSNGKVVFTNDGIVTGQAVNNVRMNIGGVVSGTNVQQSKNQIPKANGKQ